MSDLLKKLERLYKVAIIRPEEESQEARMNEARTAAFLLLKLAREGGVKIVFRLETNGSSAPAKPNWSATETKAPPRETAPPPSQGVSFSDFMNAAQAKGPKRTADFFEELGKAAAATGVGNIDFAAGVVDFKFTPGGVQTKRKYSKVDRTYSDPPPTNANPPPGYIPPVGPAPPTGSMCDSCGLPLRVGDAIQLTRDGKRWHQACSAPKATSVPSRW